MRDPAEITVSHGRALHSPAALPHISPTAHPGADGAYMSASSSRIMIAPVDGGRPLSDRFIDRLLDWWDVGGGRRMRRAVRGAAAVCGSKISTTVAPLMARPLIAKSVATSLAGLTATRRWLGKAFAYDAPAAAPRAEAQRAEIDAKVIVSTTVADAPPRPAAVTKSATAELRTHLRSGTAELRTPTRSGTGEIKPRTAPAITKPVITPVSSTESQTTAMTANLRCWSCLQRNRVRTPRRGGCFLCAGCNATMLVVDPIVGLTCDVGQAESKGISLNRQADETDSGLR